MTLTLEKSHFVIRKEIRSIENYLQGYEEAYIAYDSKMKKSIRLENPQENRAISSPSQGGSIWRRGHMKMLHTYETKF